MPIVPHTPPGRAGRLWLRERLALAEHAMALLDTKVRLLRRELDELVARTARTELAFTEACAVAERWTQRAEISGSARDLRLATPAERADVTVQTGTIMGVALPQTVTCRIPAHPAGRDVTGGVAVVAARDAVEQALRAAADHAAATGARVAVEQEIARTSQRLLALRNRWIPRLEGGLRTVEATLDEWERADSARLRWATARDD